MDCNEYFIQALRHLAFCMDSVEQTVNELAEVGIECDPIRVDDYQEHLY